MDQSKRSEIASSILGFLAVLLMLWGQFGGIYMSFSRHGTKRGFISIFVPPVAWYHSISWIWDTPKSVKDREKHIFPLGTVVLAYPRIEIKDRASMAEAVETLAEIFKDAPVKQKARLDKALTALIDCQQEAANAATDLVMEGKPEEIKSRLLPVYESYRPKIETVPQLLPILEESITELDNATAPIFDIPIDREGSRTFRNAVKELSETQKEDLVTIARTKTESDHQKSIMIKNRILYGLKDKEPK